MNQLQPAALIVLMACAGMPGIAADKPAPAGATGPYDNVAQWLKPLDPGRVIYPLTVFAQSPDRIFIGIGGTSLPLDKSVSYEHSSWQKDYPGARADHKLIVVDHNGKVVEDWAQ